jgi:hypothetical protein
MLAIALAVIGYFLGGPWVAAALFILALILWG